MTKILIVIAFLFLITPTKSISEDEKTMVLNSVLNIGIRFFLKNTNLSILNTTYFINCSKYLGEVLTSNFTLLFQAFEYCGKGLSDLGNEKECNRLAYDTKAESNKTLVNFTYFQLVYDVNINSINNDEDKDVMKFLNQSRYYTGFCMVEQCMDFLEIFFNNETNKPFTDFLTGFGGVASSKIVRKMSWDDYYEKWKDDNNKKSYAFKVLFQIFAYFILAYLVLKLLASFIRITFFSSGYDKTYTKLLKKKEEEKKRGINSVTVSYKDESMSQSSIDDKISNDTSNNIFSNSSNLLLDGDIDGFLGDEKYPLKLRLLKILDLSDNLGQLTSSNSKLYNDKGIEPLLFLRIIILFFLVFNHNIYTLTHIPARDYLNIGFYRSYLFTFIKMSINSPICWIIIEGAICSYKLMSYIKKDMIQKGTNNVQFTTILKFFALCVPKVIVFIIIYFFFHYLSFYIGMWIDSMPMFDFYMESICQSKQCYKDSIFFSLPIIPYLDFAGDYDDNGYFVRKPFFSNCYKFTNIFINEFYCFIIFLLYIFFSNKIKSKIVDYCLLAGIIINSGLSFFQMTNIPGFLTKEEKQQGKTDDTFTYYLKYVLGHNYFEKYTHLFINFYFLGVLVGMSYFYYYDAVAKNSLTQQKDTYIPFSYCYKFIQLLDGLNKYAIYIIRLIIIGILIFISSSYNILLALYSDTTGNADSTLSLEVNGLITIIYFSEKLFFAIFFAFLAVLSIFQDKEGAFKHLMNSNIFNPFNRCSFIFFCISDTVIYISYCIFIFRMNLTYQNILFLTIGMVILISILSFVGTTMFIYPLRLLIKKLINFKNSDKKYLPSNPDKNDDNINTHELKDSWDKKSEKSSGKTVKKNIKKLYEL